MALINCPECNHQISDKAYSCPNCGYPISISNSENSIIENDNTSYCIIYSGKTNNSKLEVIKTIRMVLNIDLSEAKALVDNVPSFLVKGVSLDTAKNIQTQLNKSLIFTEIEKYNINNSKVNEKELNQLLNKYQDDTIRCPHCGSTAVTTGQKGFSLLTGFLGSNKTVNRCGKCGWSWQPK